MPLDLHPQAAEERERMLALLRQHGWNATSFQALEPPFRRWFDGDDACVAYVDAGRTWVAAGAPIAHPDRVSEVAARFVQEAARHGRGACFFAVEGRFVEAMGWTSLCVGEQPVWDPSGWSDGLKGSKSLREQLRRARARGVTVREIPGGELAVPGSEGRRRVEALLTRWLTSRQMAPMGFLVELELFDFAVERRYFAAELDGRLVALLSAVPVYARGGWFFEDLLRDPAAPNGTPELLVDSAMTAIAAAGSHYATLGLAPLAGNVHRALQVARRLGAPLYDFEGVRAFKAKLRPTHWDPIFLAHPPDQRAALALFAVLSAFANGNLFRFGLQSALRGPPIVVRLLAALLIPWTIALASVDTQRWFPAPAVHTAWVAFDVALCISLWILAARWRLGLARALAAVITGDAVLTSIEVLLYNVPRAHHLGEWCALLVSVLAPLGASFVMWGALAARRRGSGWLGW